MRDTIAVEMGREDRQVSKTMVIGTPLQLKRMIPIIGRSPPSLNFFAALMYFLVDGWPDGS